MTLFLFFLFMSSASMVLSFDILNTILPNQIGLLPPSVLAPFIAVVIFYGIFLSKKVTKKSLAFALTGTFLISLLIASSLNFSLPESLPPLGGNIGQNIIKLTLGKIEGSVKKTSYNPNQVESPSLVLNRGIQGVGGAVDISGIQIKLPQKDKFARITGHILLLLFMLNFIYFLISELKKFTWSNVKSSFVLSLFKDYLFFVTIFSLGMAYLFLNTKTVYIWDFNNYWMRTMSVLDQLNISHLPALFKSIASSVIGKEYNELPALPLALWGKIFGLSRVSYILSIVFLYLAPSFTLAINLPTHKKSYLSIFLFILLFPILFSNTFDGFVISGALIFICLFIKLYFSKINQIVLKNVLLAMLLIFTSIFIRWYLFWAVGISIAIVLNSFSKIKNDKKTFHLEMVQLSIFALANLIILTLFLGPLFSRIIGANYAQVYSDMNLGLNYFEKILLAIKNIGPLSFISLLFIIFSKLKDQKIQFFTVSFIVPFLLFLKIQFLGPQHIVGLAVFPLFLTFLFAPFEFNSTKKVFSFFLLLGLFSTYTHLAPAESELATHFSNSLLLTSERRPPIKRHDTNELMRLSNFIDTMAKKKRVYVLASSLAFNDETLGWLEASLGLSARPIPRPQMLRVNHIDKRDLVPLQILDADYVIIPENVQLHYPKESQDVVYQPWYYFMSNSGIAKSFQRRAEVFRLDIGQVFIYEKISPISDDDKRQFIQEVESKI